jgi:hypothetical protein
MQDKESSGARENGVKRPSQSNTVTVNCVRAPVVKGWPGGKAVAAAPHVVARIKAGAAARSFKPSFTPI